MRNRLILPLALAAVVVGGLALEPSGRAGSGELQEVVVTNFPDRQRVEGVVSVEEPIPAAELRSFTDVTVPPVRPEETTRLVHAGTLDASGYAHAVLSLVAQARGASHRPGTVGAILLPDEEPIHEALFDHGKELLSLRLGAPAASGLPTFFASPAQRQNLAFPRYQVYLFNTTDTSVRVNVYAYLQNGG